LQQARSHWSHAPRIRVLQARLSTRVGVAALCRASSVCSRTGPTRVPTKCWCLPWLHVQALCAHRQQTAGRHPCAQAGLSQQLDAALLSALQVAGWLLCVRRMAAVCALRSKDLPGAHVPPYLLLS